MDNELIFPKGFLFGAATASFQIEGDRQGRGDCIWDDYCRREGNILDGSDGDVACDHVNRYKEDVAIMKKIGLKAYRFSVSWPRVFPDDSGIPNEKGVKFYNDLINELIANDIVPFITLFHWDMPSWVYRKGGWMNDEVSEIFGEYARFIAKTYGDRVKYFITFNEPQSFLPAGHHSGRHAPGLKLDVKEWLRASHNFFRAHGYAVKAIRETVPDAKISITMSTDADFPLTDSKEDIEAATKSILTIKEDYYWHMSLRYWCDPIYLGEYPPEMYERFGDKMPVMSEDDRKLISQPLDFIAQNCYSASAIVSDGNGGFKVAKQPLGKMKNSLNWSVTPRAIWFVIKTLWERYKLPVYITENGICCNDWICEDGFVHDSYRIDFYKKYLKNVRRAITEGADVRGFFAWSLMDNFEWGKGYSERFGLVYVDYATQKRTLKDSALFYKQLIYDNEKE